MQHHNPVPLLNVPKSDDDTQENLIALADGDETRFSLLFVRYAPKLRSHLLKQGVPPSAAEELVQETLIRVWRKASKYDPESGDGVGWIYRIARNVRIDAARREQHADAISTWKAFQAEPPTPEDECLALERAKRLEAALLELPSVQAETLRRALLRHGTLAEVAQELNLPLSTAKSHVRRAIAHIRRRLDQEK